MRTSLREVQVGADRAAVVGLAGTLTVESAPAARGALLEAIAAQPSVVVADVTAVTVPDDVVLSLFPAIARSAAAWPSIPLVLAGPGRALAAALDRTAVGRYLPVVDSVATGCRASDTDPPRRLVSRPSAGPDAVTHARAVIAEACGRWGVTGITDVAELLATELASNAVRHVGGVIETSVTLRLRHLHISVRDNGTDPPRLGRNDGRGLMVIDALTVAWGTTALRDGKVVWATLRLP
jgi:anti-sigma regulatory factor (Ser/Thr protein kinase)/anti-anti-sigma regulatory factor